MTQNNHSSHDRLQRIRGFTIGGKTWEREETDSETVSSSTHFQLGNLFVTFVCYNGTHLGLALAKSTLIKCGIPGSKSPSISAIPIAELSLPSSPYTVCGQIFSLLPRTKNGSEWAWDGKFVSLSVKKKGKQGVDDPSRLQNLQLSISSRLIDPIMQSDRHGVLISELGSTENDICFNSEREKTWVFSSDFILAVWYRLKERIESGSTLHDKIPVFGGVHDGVFPYQAGPTESSPGVTYAFSILNTAIFDAIANRQACRTWTYKPTWVSIFERPFAMSTRSLSSVRLRKCIRVEHVVVPLMMGPVRTTSLTGIWAEAYKPDVATNTAATTL
ncbi:hypothetical protein B0H10DRAFT_1955810 [Mycena sp. CBHHK59/15]|nr:hypothetical protein B0H10DRAFT_1955810 [Mycena sp. CBHHK59/15]